MSIRKRYTIDELRVNALDAASYYWINKYKVEDASKKRQKTKKAEFEEFLNEEMKKYPLGFNPYQE